MPDVGSAAVRDGRRKRRRRNLLASNDNLFAGGSSTTTRDDERNVNLMLSLSPLLSGRGRADDCADPLGPSCVGGIASVAAHVRSVERGSDADAAVDRSNSTTTEEEERSEEPTLFLPWADLTSAFVHMHPLGRSVNRLVLRDRFRFRGFLSGHSLLSSWSSSSSSGGGNDPSYFGTKDMPYVMTNALIPPGNPWHYSNEAVLFDEETGLAVLHVMGEGSTMAAGEVESALGGLDHVARVNSADGGCFGFGDGVQKEGAEGGLRRQRERRSSIDAGSSGSGGRQRRCWIPVVVYNAISPSFRTFLESVTRHANPPAVVLGPPLPENDDGDSYDVPAKIRDTWVSTFRLSSRAVHQIQLSLASSPSDGDDDPATRVIVSNVTVVARSLIDVPVELKNDTEYISDQAYLRDLALEARRNDPVVGTSLSMPLVRSDAGGVYVRNCMGGECPLGNLWTDALRWAGNADVAFAPSGGLRGPGWPSGNVTVSDLYEAMPFPNRLCTGTISGITLSRMLNHSTSVATFQSTWTEDGDHLLQASGLRYAYNTNWNGTRLVRVDVWNETEKTYQPLERLRLYRFAAENFLCDAFEPFPSFLRSDEIQGEVPGTVVDDGDRYVQSVVAEYLSQLDGPHDTSLQGRLVNDTSATTPLNLVQTEEDCTEGTFWDDPIRTCVVCPRGTNVAFLEDRVELEAGKGDDDSSTATTKVILSNREAFDVSVSAKSIPSWMTFAGPSASYARGESSIRPNESVELSILADASSLEAGTATSTISFDCFDAAHPACRTGGDATFDVLLRVYSEERLNHLGPVRWIGLALMFVVVFMSVGFALWTRRNRNARIVRASQPFFLGTMTAGALVLGLAIVPLSVDDGIASQHMCDVACMATPWMVSLGFTTLFSALFSKIWRINKIMHGARMCRRVKVTEGDVLKPFVALLSMNFAFLLVWTLVDPIRWVREPVDSSVGSTSRDTYGKCHSDGAASWILGSLVASVDVGALVLACVQAYRARYISDEFSESKYIGIAMFSWLQVVAVGIPSMFLAQNDPRVSFFLRSSLIFAACASVLSLMFVPKVLYLRNQRKGEAAAAAGRESSTSVDPPPRDGAATERQRDDGRGKRAGSGPGPPKEPPSRQETASTRSNETIPEGPTLSSSSSLSISFRDHPSPDARPDLERRRSDTERRGGTTRRRWSAHRTGPGSLGTSTGADGLRIYRMVPNDRRSRRASAPLPTSSSLSLSFGDDGWYDERGTAAPSGDGSARSSSAKRDGIEEALPA